MTHYEIALQLMFNLATFAVEIDECTDKHQNKLHKKVLKDKIMVLKNSPKYQDINPTKLSRHEMLILGFKPWEENSKMLLIPFWLWPFLENGFECKCIDNEVLIFDKESCDNDHRFGMLSYQVKSQNE